MKVYRGFRDADGCAVVTVDGLPLAMRNDLANHSPDGPEWSYSGSGPAQLALALCADVLKDDQEALKYYHAYKWKVVAHLPHDGWELTELEVQRRLAVL